MRAPGMRLYLLLVVGALGSAALFGASPAASATLPSGFAETQVATGLASPTAMAFAPDGRLFVAEQGGRLRVIKNGTLLAAPFITLSVDSAGRARPPRHRPRPRLRLQPVRLPLLHDGKLADPQPHQPLHRQRRRRHAGQRGADPEPRDSLQRHEPQRRRDPLRSNTCIVCGVPCMCIAHTPRRSAASASISASPVEASDVVDDFCAGVYAAAATAAFECRWRWESTWRQTCDDSHGAAQFFGGVDRRGKGRVLSPPMSMMSAPASASRSACSIAAWRSKKWPPSEKLSGVTLTCPSAAGDGRT